jgi:hypothetical protein
MDDAAKLALCQRAIKCAWTSTHPQLLINPITTAFVFLEGENIAVKLGKDNEGYALQFDNADFANDEFLELRRKLMQ